MSTKKCTMSYIDTVPYEESRKAFQKMAAIFTEKAIEDDARCPHLQKLIADINERSTSMKNKQLQRLSDHRVSTLRC